jgi:hypothetical protein
VQHPVHLPHRFLPLGAREEPAVGRGEGDAPQQPLAGVGGLDGLEELDEVAVDDEPPAPLPDVGEPVVAQEVGEVLVEVEEAAGRILLGLAQVQIADDEVVEGLGRRRHGGRF